MGAIHHQTQPIQPQATGERHFYRFDIAPDAVFHAAHAPHGMGLGIVT